MPRLAIGAVVMAVGVGVVWLVVLGCGMAQPTATKPRSDGFASDRVGPPPVAFDAERAMEYLQAVCKIGPRISGTDGMKKQQELIKKHFEDLGAKVTLPALHGPPAQRGQGRGDGQHDRLLAPRQAAPRHPLLALRHPAHRRPGAEPRAAGTTPSSAPTTAAPASPC